MNIKISIVFIWILALATFGYAGYLAYTNSKAPTEPQSFASEVLGDTEAQDDEKINYCEYSFVAFEMLQQERIVSGSDEISFGNFPSKKVVITDTVTFLDFYVVPVRKHIRWPDNEIPSPAQIATVYNPFKRGAVLDTVISFRREICDLKDPITEKD